MTSIFDQPHYQAAIPQPNINALPEEERASVDHVIGQLHSLASLLERFGYAIELMEYASDERRKASDDKYSISVEDNPHHFIQCGFTETRFAQWKLIGARDGAMTVKFFYDVLAGIKFDSCPIASKSVIHSKLRDARKSFRQHFTDYEGIRDAVAHFGESIATATWMKRHSITKPFSMGGLSTEAGVSAHMPQALFGSTIAASWKSKHENDATIKQVTVDRTSLKILASIFAQTCAAIEPMEKDFTSPSRPMGY